MAFAMVSTSTRRMRVAALILAIVGIALAASSVQVSAQTTAWAQRETPAGALARHIRVLAKHPKDFLALIGAGKAALALGDTQAAIGFFGRANEVFPTSPLPQAGLGAAMASDGDAYGALSYFARAQQLGAHAVMVGADRGLAYDLLARHSEAQADYRAALSGSDAEEARRRLALSLAITGDKAAAIEMLGPLMARGDAAAARCRALVLALSGDMEGARRSLDAAMPGSSARMAPFFAKLPSLRSDQKAAAVNLGIFPDSGQPSYAYIPQPSARGPIQPPVPTTSYVAAAPPRSASPRPSRSVAGAIPMDGDRLASIDQLLRGSQSRSADERAVQMASITPQIREKVANQGAQQSARPRVWVQLASGQNPDALPAQFQRIKTRHRELLEGMSGYVAEGGNRARLLIGPFKSAADANIIVEDLESVRVDAFSWTSPPGQTIRKLSTE
jgi:Flp pilus assembly protein TadD